MIYSNLTLFFWSEEDIKWNKISTCSNLCYQSLLSLPLYFLYLVSKKFLMSSHGSLRFTKSAHNFFAFLILPYNCCFAAAPILGSHLLQVTGPPEQPSHHARALHCFSLLHKAICLLLVWVGHYWSLSSSEAVGTPLTTLCTYEQSVLNPDVTFLVIVSSFPPCTEYGFFYNILFHSVLNTLSGT